MLELLLAHRYSSRLQVLSRQSREDWTFPGQEKLRHRSEAVLGRMNLRTGRQ